MSPAQHYAFSPYNLSVLGGLLFVALILGEVVFSRNNNEGVAVGESMGVGSVKDVERRIKPVITLTDVMTSGIGSVEVAQNSPKKLYDGACMACHAAGVAGAPKTGDGVAWQSRLGAGVDALVASAISGKGAMPPNGGSTYSEQQLRSVIEYILAESGL